MAAYALRDGLILSTRLWRIIMSDKAIGSSSTTPSRNLREDGITNPKDGRGPLRKSDDSSTKLPLHTSAPKTARPN